MLHHFTRPGDWFEQKRFGYGAGMPIAWQGWVVLLTYGLAVAGIAFYDSAQVSAAGGSHSLTDRAPAFMALLGVTGVLVLIARRRTRGGWRWRWGGRD